LHSFVGVDVSKHGLDIHRYPASLSIQVPNDLVDVEDLSYFLKKYSVQYIAIEATGGCEQQICNSLFCRTAPTCGPVEDAAALAPPKGVHHRVASSGNTNLPELAEILHNLLPDSSVSFASSSPSSFGPSGSKPS
jgi:hypothetical protein